MVFSLCTVLLNWCTLIELCTKIDTALDNPTEGPSGPFLGSHIHIIIPTPVQKDRQVITNTEDDIVKANHILNICDIGANKSSSNM